MDNSGLLSRLWLLSRPKLACHVVFVSLCGYCWALWDRALAPVNLTQLGIVLLAWYLLQVGTIWLNAGLDRDEGEVLLGKAVPVPTDINLYAYIAFTCSIFLAGFTNQTILALTVISVVLSLCYSHPRLAYKGHAVAGPLINLVGYGLFTPLVGWAVVEVPVNARTLAVWFTAAIGLLGCYWASQAFQREEDLKRGYRTLVVLIGAQKTILTGRLCTAFCASSLLMLVVMGWLPQLSLLLLLVWFWIDRWFVVWGKQANGGSEYFARVHAKRMVLAVLFTVALALADCVVRDYYQLPLAGLSTSSGLPEDSPVLSVQDFGQRDKYLGLSSPH